jgi:hypothetical protein
MATLKSTNINAGDPVTADIINNLVLDLNAVNAATAPTFKLTLDSTGTKQDAASVSQKVYSNILTKEIAPGTPKTFTWNFSDSNIKFTNVPRCWVQLQNTNKSLSYTAFNFTIVIVAVSTKSMSFQVRGTGFTKATHDFICFAADA